MLGVVAAGARPHDDRAVHTLLAADHTFVFYGTEHWTVLALTALATVVPCLLLRRFAATPRQDVVERGVCWSFAAILSASFIGSHIQRMIVGEWALYESLPLHLCDWAVIATIVSMIGADRLHCVRAPSPATRDRRGLWAGVGAWQQLYELAYFWVLGGTSQALLTPDVVGRFPQITCIRFFVLHGGIVAAVLVLTLGMGIRPLRGAVPRAWLITLAGAVVVGGINALLRAAGIDANYMYLCGPPTAATLISLLGPYPWSLAALSGVATIIFALLYLPFWIIDRRTAITGPSEISRAR